MSEEPKLVETREVWLVVKYQIVIARKWSLEEAKEFVTFLQPSMREGILIEHVIENVMSREAWTSEKPENQGK